MFSRTVERVLNAGRPRGGVAAARPPDPRAPAVRGRQRASRGRRSCAPRARTSTRLREELDRLPGATTWSAAARAPSARREQTLAFRRVLQTAVLHVQSAGKTEADVGDILAALLRAAALPRGGPADRRQGVTRLDVLNYISHGITQGPDAETAEGGEPAAGGRGRGGRRGRPAIRSPPTP